MDFNLEQRLAWLQPGHFTFDKQVTVLEKEEGGRADVLVHSKAGHNLCLVNTTQKNRLAYIRYQKVADGTLCEILNDGSVRLHLIECKKTVKSASWSKAIKQFEGGLVNMLAVCGVLGITEVSEVIVYTAFQNLSMDPTTSANPALLKMPVGGNTPTELQQWQHNKVHIQGKVFKHVPVQLDANGTGELSV